MTPTLFPQESERVPFAIISPCGAYRYVLWRCWDPDLPCVVFIMLNPSNADAETDDPTIRRCRSFAQSWGFGSIRIVNLYAYRSPNPRDLVPLSQAVRTGPLNDSYIKRVCAMDNAMIVAAWGAHQIAVSRVADVSMLIGNRPIYCLGENKNGTPKHPLYCRSGLSPQLLRGSYE